MNSLHDCVPYKVRADEVLLNLMEHHTPNLELQSFGSLPMVKFLHTPRYLYKLPFQEVLISEHLSRKVSVDIVFFIVRVMSMEIGKQLLNLASFLFPKYF